MITILLIIFLFATFYFLTSLLFIILFVAYLSDLTYKCFHT